jgi:hypothetical protein
MPACSIYAPKTECLSWLNELVGSDYTKVSALPRPLYRRHLHSFCSLNPKPQSLNQVEQCANGAAFCQVMDRLYAGEFPIKKVSIKSHPTSQDSLRNYKLLQQFFKAKGIEKTFDISKLTNAKPMDNLEFLQVSSGPIIHLSMFPSVHLSTLTPIHPSAHPTSFLLLLSLSLLLSPSLSVSPSLSSSLSPSLSLSLTLSLSLPPSLSLPLSMPFFPTSL